MDINWSNEVVEQLDWHWQNQLRPRLEGLTDQEYFWEPVPGCWSLRKRGTSTAPRAARGGGRQEEYASTPPQHDQPHVRSSPWRLDPHHAGLFGRPQPTPSTATPPRT